MLKLDRQHVVRLERTQHAGDKRLRPCRTTGRFVSRTRTQVDCSQTRRSTPISSPRLPKGLDSWAYPCSTLAQPECAYVGTSIHFCSNSLLSHQHSSSQELSRQLGLLFDGQLGLLFGLYVTVCGGWCRCVGRATRPRCISPRRCCLPARQRLQVNLVLMRDGHVRDTVVREVHMVSLSRLHSRCFRDAWESRCELLVRVQIIEIDHGRPASSSSPFGRPSPASQLFRFVGRTR